jgi:TetR/AcrR family transcriptional regulator, tetracycline repressor protein
VPSSANRVAPLSREVILDAALRVTEREGFDRLTMRALASELGVTPMAIYYHVPDKESLVSLVVDEIHAQQGSLELGDDGWEASLRRYITSQWEVLARYPGVGAHLLDQPLLGGTPDSIARGMAFFEAAGFSPRRARLAWSFAMTYLHGRLSVDARLHGRAPAAVKVAGIRSKDYVAFGVDAVVEGLRAMLVDADD